MDQRLNGRPSELRKLGARRMGKQPSREESGAELREDGA